MAKHQDSGGTSPASFARYDHDGLCWRTSQRSLFGGLTEFSERLPTSGTMRSGRLYRQPTWEPRTFVAASSSSLGYPTPRASDADRGGRGELLHMVKCGRPRGPLVYPTPSATPYGTNKGGAAGRVGPARPSLDTMARSGRWPTATAGDAKSSGSRNLEGSKAHAGVSLTDAVRFGNSSTPRTWATTQDGANNGAPSQHDRNSLPLNAQAGGALNPDWVELLMGFPRGYTTAPTPRDGSKG